MSLYYASFNNSDNLPGLHADPNLTRNLPPIVFGRAACCRARCDNQRAKER